MGRYRKAVRCSGDVGYGAVPADLDELAIKQSAVARVAPEIKLNGESAEP